MTPIEIGILGIVVLVVLLLIRVPVGISLIIVAAGGSILLTPGGFSPALTQLGGQIAGITQNQNLSAIPLFVLMGVFINKTNLGRALFEVLNYIFGKAKGGSAMATIGSGAFYATVCDSSVSDVSSFLDQPTETGKRKSIGGFYAGLNKTSASLSLLILPGSAFIMYAFLSAEPFGAVLLSGVAPAIIITILLMLKAALFVMLKPEFASAPVQGKTPLPTDAFKIVWVVPVIFILIFGSIFYGLMTPPEAAAMGAFLVLIFLLATRSLSLKIITESLIKTAVVSGKLFILLIGGSLFGFFLRRSLIELSLVNYFLSLDLAPIVIIILFLIVYTLLGLILDKLAILVIMTPITYPIITAMGMDGIWFGVMTMLMLMSAQIVNKVGNANLLPISSEAPSGNATVIRLPFLLVIFVFIVFATYFPVIATLFPRLMYGW
ncbi:MAG: TRAP transporter large permease subunit [Oscillospiraceae bacterium]|nr:TRAP transporter large permease subunit [Oscillospiraceae bacterium]